MDDFKVLEKHKKQINEIAGYQKLEGKRFGLLQHQIAEIPFVAGLSVLDVGCNAGLHSLVASKYCPSVTGVEELHNVHVNSLEMQAYFRENIQGYHPERVRFIYGPVSNIEGSFDAVLAFNVFYHLDKPSLRRMTAILEGSKRVLVQARKKAKKDQNNLNLTENIVQYLEKIGFNCVVKNPQSSRPFVLGQK